MRAGCATEPQCAGAGQLECAVDREACSGVCVYCRVFLEQCFFKEGCPGLISSIYFMALLFTLACVAIWRPWGASRNMSRILARVCSPLPELVPGTEIRVRACAVAAAARERRRLKK